LANRLRRGRLRERDFLDRLTITGLIQRDVVAETQAAFDVAVQPQAILYASPLKLFEYMALGHAIVAPDQPNLKEVLAHNETALLFDPADAQAFKAAIAKLVRDVDLRENLGTNAAKAVRNVLYTWDGNAQRIVAVDENLAQSG